MSKVKLSPFPNTRPLVRAATALSVSALTLACGAQTDLSGDELAGQGNAGEGTAAGAGSGGAGQGVAAGGNQAIPPQPAPQVAPHVPPQVAPQPASPPDDVVAPQDPPSWFEAEAGAPSQVPLGGAPQVMFVGGAPQIAPQPAPQPPPPPEAGGATGDEVAQDAGVAMEDAGLDADGGAFDPIPPQPAPQTLF